MRWICPGRLVVALSIVLRLVKDVTAATAKDTTSNAWRVLFVPPRTCTNGAASYRPILNQNQRTRRKAPSLAMIINARPVEATSLRASVFLKSSFDSVIRPKRTYPARHLNQYVVHYSKSDKSNSEDSLIADNNFDGKGFFGYLGPYILATFVSLTVTALFVKFVMLDS